MKNNSEYSITWVGLLLIKDRKILTTREKGKDLFQLPGGGQDNNECLEATLKREVKEELCADIKNPKIYDDIILPGRHEKVLIRFIIYTADVIGEIKAGEDIEEIKWIDSNYEKYFLDIGNPLKLKLVAKLFKENVID